MRMKLTFAFLVLVSMMPAGLLAQPRTVGVHIRQQLSHDRSPRLHDRSARPHLGSLSGRT